MELNPKIEREAAQWIARRDSDAWTRQDQVLLDEWLERSSLHAVIFIRQETAWRRADKFKALGAGFPAGVVPGPEQFNFDAPTAPVKPKRYWPIGLAAAVALGLGGVLAGYLHSLDSVYSTPVGGVASVPMKDGSSITLNTDTKIRITLNETQRSVNLARGEAYFEVAKDGTRPFQVNAGNKRIVVLGTRFSVRREANDIRVAVTEGKVRIEHPAHNDVVELGAGDTARATDGGIRIESKPLVQVQEFLSWRTGYVVLWEADLKEAVAEFNRYNDRQLVIADPALTAIRLSGKFRATNLEAFVTLLKEGFRIEAREDGERIFLNAP